MLCGILFLTAGTVSAQDIIVLNNKTADEIEAKIMEVSNNEVKYKKWNYQDGPTFSVSTNEIFAIKYQNGEKQTFFEQADSRIFRSPAKPKEKRQGDFKPRWENSVHVGYVLGIGDYMPDAVVAPEYRIGYRFNPYFSLGGSVGNLLFYDTPDTSGLIPILVDARGYLPLGKKISLYTDFGLGANVGYGSFGTDFTLQVGPGVQIGKISISTIYHRYGEDRGGMAFKLGFHF